MALSAFLITAGLPACSPCSFGGPDNQGSSAQLPLRFFGFAVPPPGAQKHSTHFHLRAHPPAFCCWRPLAASPGALLISQGAGISETAGFPSRWRALSCCRFDVTVSCSVGDRPADLGFLGSQDRGGGTPFPLGIQAEYLGGGGSQPLHSGSWMEEEEAANCHLFPLGTGALSWLHLLLELILDLSQCETCPPELRTD